MNRPMVLQAITTRYMAPSSHRSVHVKAIAWSCAFTLPWDDRYDAPENHWLAAEALATKMGWLDGRHLEGGCLHTQDYAFVLVKDAPT